VTHPAIAATRDYEGNQLTPRQARILQLVADGHPDRSIAQILGISTRTVHAHLQHAYRALDVTSRTEALARLRERPAMRPAPQTPGSQDRAYLSTGG
jgi:DNA-binding CsgD family transcriptional regulator